MSLAYQVVADALLVAILAMESVFDKTDWLADDVMKKLNSTDASCLKLWQAPNIEDKEDVAPAWWNDWGALSFGCLGALLAVEAEILLVGEELGS